MKKLLIFCFLTASILSNAQDNIQWRGTSRTGIYNETGLLTKWPAEGPEMKWHFDGLGDGHSSVAINGEKIYLTGLKDGKGILYMFDLAGKLIKQKEYGQEWDKNYEGPRGTVTIDGDKLYLISGHGELFCMDKNTLSTLWEKAFLKDFDASNINWGINESPLIIGNMVITTPGGSSNNMIAFNKNSGAVIWTSKGEGDQAAYCSPLYIDDQEVPQIVSMTANHIIGVDAKTGEKLWSYENTNRWSVHANTPVYNNNMILCTSGYGAGSVMLKLIDGGRNVEKVWASNLLDNQMGGMVKIGDYAYGSGHHNRKWYCVDWKTGKIVFEESGLAMGNVIANNNMLYCYTNKGEILLVKATPEKFDIVSRFKVTKGTAQHWAHPVIYNGTLYVRHGDSLMAYNIK